MGFTECLIHKSSLLSLSLGALDALSADGFTNVSVINCGFYIDLHQQIGEWSAFTPEPIQCLSFSAIINDSEVINLHVLKIKLIVLFRHAVPAATGCTSVPVTRMDFQDVASHCLRYRMRVSSYIIVKYVRLCH